MKIKLTTMHSQWPWTRQTPGGAGAWRGAEFVVDQAGQGGDWWFVYDDLPTTETIQCEVGQTVLVTPEPPALKKYDPKFVAQFDWVITGDRSIIHPQKIYTHQGLPWHVGRLQRNGENLRFTKSYDELKALGPIPKTKTLSVIASDKRHHPGHKARFEFVQRLQHHFGERLDVFGWGGREIPDKWDGIAPYRYHIAIENSACPDYWTEKLSDAFLAGAHPIYYGCPNILDYFKKESLTFIDIRNPEAAIGLIEKAIAAEPLLQPISEARDLVLERHNLFNLLFEFALQRSSAGVQQTKTLYPASAFYKPPTLIERVRRKIKSLT